MSAQLETPLDPVTRTPLPIAPKCREIKRHQTETADDHHGWHPRNHPLFSTVAGLALRNSWMQFIERDLHNEGELRYHRFFSGPEIPSDEVDIFGRCVIACAGYVPDLVIDTKIGDYPFTRPAKTNELAFLRAKDKVDPFSRRYIRYGYTPIREFFRDFALKQNISNVKNGLLDEFVNTTDTAKRIRIGQHLLWVVAEIATGEIRDTYSYLASRGLLHPAMPSDPKPLLKWKLGSPESTEAEVIPMLAHRISLQDAA